tara:strand:- start:507 stop:1202 length:696 start_codon:yes stop_codon:yes gene_type:complete
MASLPPPSYRPQHPDPFQRAKFFRRGLQDLPAPVLDAIAKIKKALERDFRNRDIIDREYFGYGYEGTSPLSRIIRGEKNAVEIKPGSDEHNFMTFPESPVLVRPDRFSLHNHPHLQDKPGQGFMLGNLEHSKNFSTGDIEGFMSPQFSNRFKTNNYLMVGEANDPVTPLGAEAITSLRLKPHPNRFRSQEHLWNTIGPQIYGKSTPHTPEEVQRQFREKALEDYFDFTVFE